MFPKLCVAGCVAVACLLFLTIHQGEARYEPNWKSLDSRPVPSWYDDGKIGIFIHWGVFSVPAFGSEWFWWSWKGSKSPAYEAYMKKNYRPSFTYADFAPMFKAEFYDPKYWASLFKKAGAKYIVLVTKHHEGFTNWPSNYSWNWNAMAVGPNRDLVGALAEAIRGTTDLRLGLYHSLFEWFHPLFLKDKANGFHTQEFVKAKAIPELHELVNTYKPDIIWSDGDWMAADTYWTSPEFVAWLYNDSPVKDKIAVNDRWGNNTRCKHGGFWNCKDHFKPGQLLPRKWENCMTIDKGSWGYRANVNLNGYHTIEELLEELIITISLGGNLLLNVGPTSKGSIIPIFQERLTQLGDWLDTNGKAIYKTHVWAHQNDSLAKNVWYTAKNVSDNKTDVYALLPTWPKTDVLVLADPMPTTKTVVTLLGYPEPLEWSVGPQGDGIWINMPQKMTGKWAWALKLEGLRNQKAPVNPEKFSRHYQSIAMRKERIYRYE